MGKAHREAKSAPRIVAVGGGTGLATLLRGLKRYTDRITAVVAVTDEGGSSGRLRRAWGVLPPGDLRNCLVALAEDDTLMSQLFRFRFPKAGAREGGGGLSGHSLGNLLLTALTAVSGGIDRALVAASQVLAIRGRVLPVSLEHVRLNARLVNGQRVVGEPQISKSRVRIQKVYLTPGAPRPSPGVLACFEEADLIVLGPGSLYTSVIPPLLVKGVAEALARSRAPKVYACNVMTQPGETDRYGAADHLQAILDHVAARAGSRRLVDVMLVNDRAFPEDVQRRYSRSGAYPVNIPPADFVYGARIVRAPLRPSFARRPVPAPAQARHAPGLLADAVMRLLKRSGK